MLNKIISFSVRNKLVVGLLVLALAAWGTYEVTRLPIDAVPDITDNQVQVITVSPSLGAPKGACTYCLSFFCLMQRHSTSYLNCPC